MVSEQGNMLALVHGNSSVTTKFFFMKNKVQWYFSNTYLKGKYLPESGDASYKNDDSIDLMICAALTEAGYKCLSTPLSS